MRGRRLAAASLAVLALLGLPGAALAQEPTETPTPEPTAAPTATPVPTPTIVLDVIVVEPIPEGGPGLPDGVGEQPALALFTLIVPAVWMASYLLVRFFDRTQRLFLVSAFLCGLALVTRSYDAAALLYVFWIAFALIWKFQDAVAGLFGGGHDR
jgi:hypothetical protein